MDRFAGVVCDSHLLSGIASLFSWVFVSAPLLGICYQRPSTAALPITIVYAPPHRHLDDSFVLIYVCVMIADAAIGSFSRMPREEYTLQLGITRDASNIKGSSLGPEVSHDAWHVLYSGCTAAIKVSPLERSTNTGRFMRIQVDVRSFMCPDVVGSFVTEPRVILSRAGKSHAILHILQDHTASDARAIGQSWQGALSPPSNKIITPISILANNLSAAAMRAPVRSKQVIRSRVATVRDIGTASPSVTDDGEPQEEQVTDNGKGSSDESYTPPVSFAPTLRRSLRGQKRRHFDLEPESKVKFHADIACVEVEHKDDSETVADGETLRQHSTVPHMVVNTTVERSPTDISSDYNTEMLLAHNTPSCHPLGIPDLDTKLSSATDLALDCHPDPPSISMQSLTENLVDSCDVFSDAYTCAWVTSTPYDEHALFRTTNAELSSSTSPLMREFEVHDANLNSSVGVGRMSSPKCSLWHSPERSRGSSKGSCDGIFSLDRTT